jgi:hypothetical protein
MMRDSLNESSYMSLENDTDESALELTGRISANTLTGEESLPLLVAPRRADFDDRRIPYTTVDLSGRVMHERIAYRYGRRTCHHDAPEANRLENLRVTLDRLLKQRFD